MTGFLITNKRGDYLAFPPESNYFGFNVRDGKTYMKTVHDISPESEAVEIGHGYRKFSDGSEQRFALDERGIFLRSSGAFRVSLDCKRRFDESDTGRIYEVNVSPAKGDFPDSLGSVTIARVAYRKYGDGSLSGMSYQWHVCIATTARVRPVGAWREVAYRYDEIRATSSTPWVYDAIECEGEGILALACDADPKRAEQKAFKLLLHPPGFPETPPDALSRATLALDSLATNEGILAGIPWFSQYWSRDELISLGGYIAKRDLDFAIMVLDRWHRATDWDGRLPAIYPDEGIVSADAPGWLGMRTVQVLRQKRVDDSRAREWHASCERLLRRIADTSGSLVESGPNETWMDTSGDDGGRVGFRIEIQALSLALYEAYVKLCTILGKDVLPELKGFDTRIVHEIHEKMVVGNVLLDGLWPDGSPDLTVRPNIFIAWYVFPRLFSAQEWSVFFASALDELFMEWGGLVSISRKSQLFEPYDTGENHRAYHRGDSWYWVNNLAAMGLLKCGQAEHARRILDASLRDIQEQGFIGHCSEISSAVRQEARGCWAQAWSASTLVELLLLEAERHPH